MDEARRGRAGGKTRFRSPSPAIRAIDAAEQRICAETYVADLCPPSPEPLWRGERYAHDRIRIAYVSGEFREHATASLTAGLFEAHDRSRFEIFGLCTGRNDNSSMRQRLESAFGGIIDVSASSDLEIATLLRQREIDIAIDLNGYFGEYRTGIFALRPCPIQVNYLGFPSTMGAPYMDYIVADAHIIKSDEAHAYSENVVLLPDTYQPNDSKRLIDDRSPARSELGLPENGFVFCCFNNNHKITPATLDIWARLLHRVDDSVLWLFARNEGVQNRLRNEAEKRGLAPERLVFASFARLPQHLARHRQADLFLDTLPHNAHTTASDALWAGLPVLTCTGRTFAGRVASSLLQAIGLPELIAHSIEDYEALALKLAREPELLTSLKAKLARNRNSYPLFDIERYTRHFEAALAAMWERYQRGEKPSGFAVDRIGH